MWWQRLSGRWYGSLESTPYTIFCTLPGRGSALCVDIEETRTVAHLKDAELPNTLATVDSHALSLYHINVDGSDKKAFIEEAKRLAQDLSSLKMLNLVDSLEDVFESCAPLRMTVHILVLAPGGEPIDPKTMLVLTQITLQTTRIVNICALSTFEQLVLSTSALFYTCCNQ